MKPNGLGFLILGILAVVLVSTLVVGRQQVLLDKAAAVRPEPLTPEEKCGAVEIRLRNKRTEDFTPADNEALRRCRAMGF